jgi:hypothetical protein
VCCIARTPQDAAGILLSNTIIHSKFIKILTGYDLFGSLFVEEGKMRLKKLLFVGLLLLALTSAARHAAAGVVSATENANLFGTLNQANTNCPNDSCGPTAAVNSLVFLQNMYPTSYPNHVLVPTVNGANPTQAEQTAVANTLATNAYMGTCAVCGTTIEDFIYGKNTYINTVDPNSTTFAAQISIAWRNPTAAGHAVAKPAYVQENTAATPGFIYNELLGGEDVEIFVGFDAGGAHYVTLTGITWDNVANTGSLAFVDPTGGGRGMDNFTTVGGMLHFTNYGGGATIFHAVAESPVPEPSTALAMLLGLVIMRALYRLRAQPWHESLIRCFAKRPQIRKSHASC